MNLFPSTGDLKWTYFMLQRLKTLNVALWFSLFPLMAGGKVVPFWPTDNRGFSEGKGVEAYIQPVPGHTIESGLFGCGRSGGRRFHEGIDIKCLRRNRQGEPLDVVYAALEGVVVHASRIPGNSSYGCYVVLYHPQVDIPLYTLYAHLHHVQPEIQVGQHIPASRPLGVMGRTSAGYRIPKEQAHVHFEVGVQLSRVSFAQWYIKQRFRPANKHGNWNGMNLTGMDPLDFFKFCCRKEPKKVSDYFAQLPTAVTLRVSTSRIPDFVRHYPKLLTRPLPPTVVAWEIGFTWFGMPIRWTPIEKSTQRAKDRSITLVTCDNAQLQGRSGCHLITSGRKHQLQIHPKFKQVIDLLFGF